MRFLSLIVLLFSVSSCSAQPAVQSPEAEAPKNVILFIADGFGPPHVTMGRDFKGRPLHLDGILTGTVRTLATNSRVTDSAAGATAYASGIKTYNGAIGVDSTRQAVATLLEAAEARGMATGLVATSRITHATPAAFAAHVPSRASEDEIAAQMMRQNVDVILGGGRNNFLPDGQGGRRGDALDLIAQAREVGYTILETPGDLQRANQTPVLGLFAGSHLDYEVDRDPAEQPSLAEMTRKALDLLEASETGFFLMVEASRIDHAAHSNDPVGTVYDVLAYDEAIAVALEFARASGNTLIVATADHETGGMTLGREGIYQWNPDVLAQVHASLDVFMTRISQGESVFDAFDAITDFALTEEESSALRAAPTDEEAVRLYRGILSRRAVIGWTTGGHTAVDVNLYAFGPGSAQFRGNLDNADVGRRIERLLGFDLDALTPTVRARLAGQQIGGGE